MNIARYVSPPAPCCPATCQAAQHGRCTWRLGSLHTTKRIYCSGNTINTLTVAAGWMECQFETRKGCLVFWHLWTCCVRCQR
jgi:hypothetical protein